MQYDAVVVMQCIHHHSFLCSVWPSDWHSWPAKVIWRWAGSCVSCDTGSARGHRALLGQLQCCWMYQGCITYIGYLWRTWAREISIEFVVSWCILWYCSAVLFVRIPCCQSLNGLNIVGVSSSSAICLRHVVGQRTRLRFCFAAMHGRFPWSDIGCNRTLSQLPLVLHFESASEQVTNSFKPILRSSLSRI